MKFYILFCLDKESSLGFSLLPKKSFISNKKQQLQLIENQTENTNAIHL